MMKCEITFLNSLEVAFSSNGKNDIKYVLPEKLILYMVIFVSYFFCAFINYNYISLFNYISSKGCLWLFEQSCVLSPNDLSSIVDLIDSFVSIVMHIL